MFYLQSYQHSRFIQFSRNCNTKFPAWFKKWLTFFGLLHSIFSPDIQEKFEFYKKNTSSQSITQPRLLMFCSRLRVPWILTWNIIKKQEQPHLFPLSLSREFNIKWWDKFNHDFVCQQKILQIISSFISRCYWFRAVSPRTHSNPQIVWRSSRKWRNWRQSYQMIHM